MPHRSGPLLFRASLCLLAAALSVDTTAAQAPRRMTVMLGPVSAHIGGDENDVLLDPGPIACRGDTIVLFDYGDMKLKAFSLSGKLRWAVGRRGQGPGEYRNPTDLRLDARGNIVLRDPQNARLLILTPTGAPLRSVPLTTQNHQVLPLAAQRFLLVGASHTAFALVLDSSGQQLREIPLTGMQRSAASIGNVPIAVEN